MMRLMVVGSESWKDIDAVWREIAPHWKENKPRFLVAYPDGGLLASQVSSLCKQSGIDRVAFPLNDAYGEDAAHHRFRLMLRMVQPDLMLAFHPFVLNSKTTRLAIDMAGQQGVEVRQIAR